MTKKPPHPSEAVRALMKRHRLTYRDVAQLAQVSPKTIEGWLATPGSASFRNMAERDLSLVTAALPAFLKARPKKD